jgi:hypothetical protein
VCLLFRYIFSATSRASAAPLPRKRLKPSAHIGVGDRLHQFLDFRLKKVVRDDQRADGRAQVAVAGGNRLVDRGVQIASVLFIRQRFRRHDAIPD